VRAQVAIVYNEPSPVRYESMDEGKAVLGVLEEVQAVHQALGELGYAAVRVSLSPPLEQAREKLEGLEADQVFNLFEGFDGRPETEAAVADILAELGLPYTGCPGSALALALDKARAKALLEASGIATPRYQLLSPETLSIFHLSYPCIVKPGAEDASHGLSEESVVYDSASLGKQVAIVSQLFGGQALVEEFVDGREFNVTVLGTRELAVLPISEIAYSLPPGMPRILTFSAKWEPQSIYFQHTKVVCPAEMGAELREHIAETALSVFRLLGCRGYARVDLRLDNEERLKVIEANPNPDISPDSGAARQAQAAGITYSQFIERIALLALERVQP
jgi:D-alanine-D-alanine ligase